MFSVVLKYGIIPWSTEEAIFYLLVVQLLGLPWFEELQQVPQSSLIIVSERIPWTVPVPGHQPPGRGGGQ